jgi:hypothetical protein
MYSNKAYSIAACMAFLFQIASPQATTADSSGITLTIDERGIVSADILIAKDTVKSKMSSFKMRNYSLAIFALPLLLEAPSKIISPPDVRISTLATGHGYTLLTVVSPISTPSTRFKIEHLTSITETREGKGKLELDLSFPLVSQAERELLSLPITVSRINVSIVLPAKYDDAEISFKPSYLVRQDDLTFGLPLSKQLAEKTTDVWIVFPNPMSQGFDNAKVVFSLVLGFFTVLFHVKALRERKLSWSITVLITSLILLGLAGYFIMTHPKGFEFLVWSAAAVPHALYGLGASMYLFLAKKLQATIAGSVSIDNQAAHFVEVSLFELDEGQKKLISSVDELKEGGKYSFFIWHGKGPKKYVVIAKSEGAKDGASQEFQLAKKLRKEVNPINLTSIPLTTDAEKRV